MRSSDLWWLSGEESLWEYWPTCQKLDRKTPPLALCGVWGPQVKASSRQTQFFPLQAESRMLRLLACRLACLWDATWATGPRSSCVAKLIQANTLFYGQNNPPHPDNLVQFEDWFVNPGWGYNMRKNCKALLWYKDKVGDQHWCDWLIAKHVIAVI